MGAEGRLKVALVQDLLVTYGGSEQVLYELHRMFPEAPIYTTVFDRARLPVRFHDLPVRTSFLQRVPSLRQNYGAVVPMMPAAFRSFDLRGYDVVISSSHAYSKSVITSPGTLHVCYCHTPLRYAWSHQDEYLAALPARQLLTPAARRFLNRLKDWDFEASRGVDVFIANSVNVRNRIDRYYGRDADIVHPHVDLDRFRPNGGPGAGAPFLVVGRLFTYKRIDVAVRACTRLGLPLRIVGRGPEMTRLRKLAGPTVTFLGEVSDAELEAEYRQCRALIFPADEDFGIVPLEAMASGRPVIALESGGALETVVGGVTGMFYADAGDEPLVDALRGFDTRVFEPAAARARAEEFSVERFRAGISAVLDRELRRVPEPVAAAAT